jgi:hypothetical protein
MLRAHVLVVFLLAGCSSSTSGPGSLGEPASLDDFNVQAAQLNCETAFRCCTPAEISAKGLGSDQASCVAKLVAMGQQSVMTADAAIAAGTLRFDSAQAAACFASLRASAQRCDGAIMPAPPACGQIVVGLAGAGAPCQSLSATMRCGAGLYCNAALGATGTCAAIPVAGEDCTHSFTCAGGAACLSNLRCGTPLAPTMSCQNNAQCLSYNCDNATCSASPRTVRDSLCKPTF